MTKAMDLTLRYTYGRTLKDMVAGADSGSVAKVELDTEGVARAFRSANPEYYNTNENYHRILEWLTDRTNGPRIVWRTDKDGQQIPTNIDAVFNHITGGGYWTVDNLQRAYNELSQGASWDFVPVAEDATEENIPITTAATRQAVTSVQPAPQSERIVRTVRRPRAGLGIRPSAAASGRAPDTVNVSAPSVDELDNLSDAEFNKLYSETLRAARQSARR
jgi:hypothetical protein